MFEVRRGKENIAGTRAQEGRYPNGAMADYTQAIKLDPKGVGAYLGRGNVRYVKGNLNGAMADLQSGHQAQSAICCRLQQPGKCQGEEARPERSDGRLQSGHQTEPAIREKVPSWSWTRYSEKIQSRIAKSMIRNMRLPLVTRSKSDLFG
jgi:hypothetical protein